MEQYDMSVDKSLKLANSGKKPKYQLIADNNVSSYGAETITAKREKKKISKGLLSSTGVKSLLVILIIITFFKTGLTIENVKYNSAVDYISSDLVTETVMNIDGVSMEEKIQSFIKEMESKGLSRNSIMFYIKEIYGNNVFDLAVQTLGFKDGGDYMISQGYKDEVLSSSGETVYATYPEEIKYEIESRHELVDEVHEIRESRKGK